MTKYKDKYRVESTRLPAWDYRNAGWYFVTICTQGKVCYFGHIVDGEMQLSAIGEKAYQYFMVIPQHFPNATVDEFVIMPNHVHAIIIILESPDVETLHATSPSPMSNISPKSGSLSAIVRSYKSAVTRWCRQNGHKEFVWQPRFYEHIVCDEQSLERIRAYVRGNVFGWEQDSLNV